MSEKIKTLDGKTSIFINALPKSYKIKIADGKRSEANWSVYAFKLIRAWAEYFDGDKIDFNFDAQNLKFSIEGLIQMTEQFLGPTTVYAKNTVKIINSKEIVYTYLNTYQNKYKDNKKIAEIKDDFTKLLDNAKETLYGKK